MVWTRTCKQEQCGLTHIAGTNERTIEYKREGKKRRARTKERASEGERGKEGGGLLVQDQLNNIRARERGAPGNRRGEARRVFLAADPLERLEHNMKTTRVGFDAPESRTVATTIRARFESVSGLLLLKILDNNRGLAIAFEGHCQVRHWVLDEPFSVDLGAALVLRERRHVERDLGHIVVDDILHHLRGHTDMRHKT